jgi:hypothetical protein
VLVLGRCGDLAFEGLRPDVVALGLPGDGDHGAQVAGPGRPIGRTGPGSVGSTGSALGGEALENEWNSAAVRHYRAAEPSRLVKDVPLYTL